MQPETVQPNSAQDAVPEVKVFHFTYEKTRSVYSSVFVPATSLDEAEKFLEGHEDLEYKLEDNVEQEEDNMSKWERVEGEVDVEKLEDCVCDWDYDNDVLPALNRL